MALVIHPKKRKRKEKKISVLRMLFVTSGHLPFPIIVSGCITWCLYNFLMYTMIKGYIKEGISKSSLT